MEFFIRKIIKKQFSNFYEIIDYIATYYILTMDFKSLSKLSDKEYCDNLVVLTSDIIQKYFNDLEVTYLEQRVKGGIDVNELKKDNIIFLNKDEICENVETFEKGKYNNYLPYDPLAIICILGSHSNNIINHSNILKTTETSNIYDGNQMDNLLIISKLVF